MRAEREMNARKLLEVTNKISVSTNRGYRTHSYRCGHHEKKYCNFDLEQNNWLKQVT